VTFRSKTRPAVSRFAVADTGPGIASEDRNRVLERFVRLEASRHFAGKGLGLSLVAAVARLHDAKLELEDNGPGLKATLLFPAGANRRSSVPQNRAAENGGAELNSVYTCGITVAAKGCHNEQSRFHRGPWPAREI